MFLSQLTQAQFGLIALAGLRIIAVVFALPRIERGGYSFFLRLMLGAAIGLVATPLAIAGSSGQISGDWLSLALSEISIGVCLGAAACCVIWGMFSAGQIISQFMGFQIGSLQQGSSPEQSNDYRKLLYLTGVMFWFAIGGHRILFDGLMQTFVSLPVGQVHFSSHWLNLLNQVIALSLQFAVRFSLPVVAAGLIGYLIAGFSSKILGSGQSYVVGMNLNQLVALALLPLMLIFFHRELHLGTLRQIETMLVGLIDSQVLR